MSHTISAHIRQCETMIDNLWQGNIYQKSLDYLLRFLLRVWLAPNRDKSNKERSAKYAISKQKLKEERVARKGERLTPSHWRHSMRTILDQLADCEGKLGHGWEEEVGPPENSAARRHAILLSDMAKLAQKRPNPVWNKQPFLPLGQSQPEAEQEGDDNDDDDHGQDDIERLIGEEKVEYAQRALDGCAFLQPPDPESMDTSTTSSSLLHSTPPAPSQPALSVVKPKEPSRKKLKSLQALLRILLESPSRIEAYTIEQVQESAFKDHDFTTAELEVVKLLVNQLRPFMPRRWKTEDGESYRSHTPHVVLRSPIVVLANAVLRVTGHNDFARRIAPHVSTGDIHSLHLGAMQLFETLCSGEKDFFDVKDINGNPLTNVANVTSPKSNKDAVFGAFFNIPRINEICTAHGIRFTNR